MRTLIISSALSLITSIVIAVALGSPISLLLGVSTTGVLVAQILERMFTARKQAAAEVAARWAADAHRRSPLELVESAQPPSWWAFGLEPPRERRVRLGTVVERGSSRVLAVDLSGGCVVTGPPHVTDAAALALNLSCALEYAPHEEAPHITTDSSGAQLRWRLDVTATAEATLTDVLGLVEPIRAIEVDLVPTHHTGEYSRWRSPAQVITPAGIDLEQDGPHAIVIGTTGSGKTEFLRAFIHSLASRFTPEELAVVVFDFKGGGSFAALNDVPHLRHLVTDLEPEAFTRAMDGLESLVVSRERLLADRGLAQTGQVDARERPPRVVIVVDEFAHLSRLHPEAVAVFTDIAARGRALGIHLVAATQRFGGSGIESLSPNAALRVCFRVSEVNDSVAVLGDGRGASARLQPGRGFIVRSGRAAGAIEVTLALETLEARAANGCIAPLWLESLKEPVVALECTISTAVEQGFLIGTRDNHEHLERTPERWFSQQGALIAQGGRDSREQLSGVLAVQGMARSALNSAASVVWDDLFALSGDGYIGPENALAIPFLDEVVASLPFSWRDDFVDELIRQAVRFIDAGAPVMLGVNTESALLRRLETVASFPLALRGGPAGVAGQWNGRTFDLLAARPSAPVMPTRAEVMLEKGDTLITPHSREWGQARSAGVRVVTPDEWIFSSGNAEASRIFLSGCTPADARALRLSADALPPPQSGTLIQLLENGTYRRVWLRPIAQPVRLSPVTPRSC